MTLVENLTNENPPEIKILEDQLQAINLTLRSLKNKKIRGIVSQKTTGLSAVLITWVEKPTTPIVSVLSPPVMSE